MTWFDVIVMFGVASWMWLLHEICRHDGFFDRGPRVCSGCQRHFVKPGCPVHDPARRSVGGDT